MHRERRRRYWRTNLSYLAILLAAWFLVSFGCGILFVDQLDRYSFSGFPLGFWFAQQGAMYVFLLIIWVYVVLMNRLDRRFISYYMTKGIIDYFKAIAIQKNHSKLIA